MSDPVMSEDQAREVAVKFARDATSLIERGKARDVCARKLVAAAAVMHPKTVNVEEALVIEVATLKLANSKQENRIEELQSQLVEAQAEIIQLKNTPTVHP